MPVRVAWNEALTRASLVIALDPGNLLTADVVRQLRTAVEDLHDAPHLRLVTIEGAGPDFSFGASIPEHRADQIGHVLPEAHALIGELLSCPAPTAAVVRGRCLGGGFELALACDFIFAAETATFGLPEIAVGVFPPAGAILLPWRAGGARATSAVLTGTARSAADWDAAGLIERMAPEAELVRTVDEWFAATLGRWSAESLRHAVRTIRAALVAVVERELPEAERRYLAELMRSEDAREGIEAFLEKRPPRWRDR
jgi:cyclohexa-1,5-dienecarbonyl-CoA hydratase